jgi:hypothetical protein
VTDPIETTAGHSLRLAAGVTVGAVLAQDMLGGDTVAGLPAALFTLGSALAAYSVGRVSLAAGRRTGFVAGFAAGALGALGVALAALQASPVLLFAAADGVPVPDRGEAHSYRGRRPPAQAEDVAVDERQPHDPVPREPLSRPWLQRRVVLRLLRHQ